MKISYFIKTFALLLAVVLVFGAAMFGLNFHTGPIIEANNKGAEFAPLLAVMPDAENFEMIYDAANPGASSMKDVSDAVLAVYKETSGKGFVVRAQASTQYSKEPMELTMGVDAQGSICGIQMDKYTDSIDFRDKDANFIPSFVGQNSTLADIVTVSGATYSSTAFKDAVSAGLSALIANDMITEAKKSDEQILTELIPTVAPGYTKLIDATASGNVTKALKSENDAGFAYIVASGDANFLAVVNAMGVCKVYDVEGKDVTDAQSAIVTEAKALAATNQKSYHDALATKITRLYANAENVQALALDTFNSITNAVSFTADGKTYYGFYSRTVGFHQMDVYIILDENGAIAKIDAKQFIFDEEYFMNFGGMDDAAYKQGFEGITSETWTGEQAIIATATMTSNAMKQSTTDAFESFATIKNGGAQ